MPPPAQRNRGLLSWLQIDTAEHVRWLFDRVKAILGPRLQVRSFLPLRCSGWRGGVLIGCLWQLHGM